MRTNEIRKAVFRIIEKYTDIEIKSDTLLRDDAGLDSMDQVEICNDIESEFNLIIEDSELFTPKVENATAGEIVEMVIAKLKEQDAQQKEAPEEETEDQTEATSDKEPEQQVAYGIQDWKSIAEDYLISKAKVWCKNYNRWETNTLSMLPDGDFVDENWRLHRKETHTAYVTLDDAIEAVRTTLAKLIDNKELELEKLKQDAFLAEKLRELSRTQEQIAKDSVYNKEF